jgi:N-acetylmuramic acid 6-phosphate etherase
MPTQPEPLGFLSELETEKANPATTEIDRLSPLEMVRVINAEDAKVAHAVEQELPQIARAIEEIAARLRRGGRLIYMGAGTSGRLAALDAAECPPTFNTPPGLIVACIAGGPIALDNAVEDVEDNAEAGRSDIAHLSPGKDDTLVGIAASGRTPYVLGGIRYARAQGAFTIGLACNRNSPLEQEVEIMIAPVVGPEVISGSTRLKAGTAQKLVLNMLSTGSMILLGKTLGNLMIDVQTTNAKLQRRAITIVRRATGLEDAAAADLLASASGEVKTAIVMARAHIEADDARRRLSARNNHLRATLDALS